MNNIFEQIEKMIELGRERGKNRFYWKLPRMAGVSTWILYNVLMDLMQGKRVILVGLPHLRNDIMRDEVFRYFINNRDLVVIHKNYNSIRGHRFDRLYGDNVIDFRTSEEVMELMSEVIPSLSDKDAYSVFIDTTEG